MDLVPADGRTSKADHVYEQLKARLIAGDYAFGEVLSTYDLAARLEVSRRPVMDAVMRLETAGFLAIIRQVGCRVILPDERLLQDHFAVAGILEGSGAQLASLHGTDEALATVEAAHHAADASVSAADVRAFAAANRRFHAAILEAADNHKLTGLAKGAWDLSDFFLRDRKHADIVSSYQEHGEILKALLAREPDQARRLMEDHLARFWREVKVPASQRTGRA